MSKTTMLSLEFTRRSTKYAAFVATMLLAVVMGMDGWTRGAENLAWLTCVLLAAHILIALSMLAINDRRAG